MQDAVRRSSKGLAWGRGVWVGVSRFALCQGREKTTTRRRRQGDAPHQSMSGKDPWRRWGWRGAVPRTIRTTRVPRRLCVCGREREREGKNKKQRGEKKATSRGHWPWGAWQRHTHRDEGKTGREEGGERWPRGRKSPSRVSECALRLLPPTPQRNSRSSREKGRPKSRGSVWGWGWGGRSRGAGEKERQARHTHRDTPRGRQVRDTREGRREKGGEARHRWLANGPPNG